VSKGACMHNGQPNLFSSIFTRAELRVINLIFSVILAEGRCTKRLDEIAQLAGTSRSTVRNSVKEAVYHGILERRERRFANAISKPNILTAPASSGATLRRRSPSVDGPRAFA
jgi:DNA-binding FadR family transcriptional regulator